MTVHTRAKLAMMKQSLGAAVDLFLKQGVGFQIWVVLANAQTWKIPIKKQCKPYTGIFLQPIEEVATLTIAKTGGTISARLRCGTEVAGTPRQVGWRLQAPKPDSRTV